MDHLTLYLLTFNCGRDLIEPTAFGSHLLDGWEPVTTSISRPRPTTLPDVIVLNLQEFAPISYAFLGGNFAKPYFDRFRLAVREAVSGHSGKLRGDSTSAAGGAGLDVDVEEYTNVITRNTGLTALMLFTRKSLVSSIRSVNAAEVGVGVSEMGNKGAVGVRVGWKVDQNRDRSGVLHTTFVSAHLAPFEAEVDRRDQDYVNIVRGLAFTARDAREWRGGQDGAESVPLLSGYGDPDGDTVEGLDSKVKGMYCEDSYLFFSGDLNYRTALTGPGREDSATFPQPRKDPDSALHYKKLLDKDQLQQQLRQGKTLHGLTEQSIDFPPTYKYHTDNSKPVIQDSDVEEWNWAKHRWPSWCDRILFSCTEALPVKAGRYIALPIFRTSDHRPVALSVSVPMKAVRDSEFAKRAPAQIDRDWRTTRDAARRKEIATGVAAYLGLSWEGRSLLLGTVLVIVSGYLLLTSL